MVGLFRTTLFGLLLAAVGGVSLFAQGQPFRTPEKVVTKHETRLSAEKSETFDKEPNNSPNVMVIVKQENPSSHKADENKGDENIAIQRKLANFTGLLVFVGFIQAVILGFTVRAIVRQTKVTQDAQRAWLLVDVEQDSEKWADRRVHILQGRGTSGDTTSFYGVVVFRNEGNSPAWIDETRANFELVDVLPEKPRLEATELIQVGPEPIGVGKAVPNKLKFSWAPIAQGHEGYGKTRVIYGMARYRDIFGGRHQTIFGFRITPSREFIRLENKPEYNKMT